MKIVIPGGTGQVGAVLKRALAGAGHEVVILTRRPKHEGEVQWDGQNLGPWTAAVDGSDVVINLAGRTVSCRYTAANLQEMMDSRVDSARVVGAAIAGAAPPPARLAADEHRDGVRAPLRRRQRRGHRCDRRYRTGRAGLLGVQCRDRQSLGAGSAAGANAGHAQGR